MPLNGLGHLLRRAFEIRGELRIRKKSAATCRFEAQTEFRSFSKIKGGLEPTAIVFIQEVYATKSR